DRALAVARLAAERNPESADAYEVLAGAERRLADAATSPADRAKHRAAGLDACARGAAVDPNQARLRATEGALLLGEARDTNAEEGRGRARDALRRVLELNPLLRSEVQPLLDEAERLGR